MRTIGNNEQVDARRARGLTLLTNGCSTAEVGSQVGVSERTVRRWRQQDRDGGPPVREKAGRRPRLNDKQLVVLQRELKRGAITHGYFEEYWTRDRIGHLIWTLFNVRFHPSAVARIMLRMGWSYQVPVRRSTDRDEKEVRTWVHDTWPQVKKSKSI